MVVSKVKKLQEKRRLRKEAASTTSPLRYQMKVSPTSLPWLRRRGAWSVFSVLLILIGVYVYLTNPTRLRMRVENWLSKWGEGRVRIGSISFSPTTGINMQDVRILVPRGGAGNRNLPILEAENLLIRFRWDSLLGARLEPTEIVVFRPAFYPSEDVETGEWNFGQLHSGIVGNQPPASRPTIRIREGEIRQPSWGEEGESRGGPLIELEGQFFPSPKDFDAYEYRIVLTHGDSPPARAKGLYNLRTGEISGEFGTLELRRELADALPARVKRWWECFEPSEGGKIEFSWGQSGGEKPEQHISLKISDLDLKIPLSRDGRLQLIGLPREDGEKPLSTDAAMSSEDKVPLTHVSGKLIFTSKHIEIQNLTGEVYDRKFTINGKFFGYTSDAGLSLDIKSDAMSIPHEAEIISRFPPAFQEAFHDLNPSGDIRIEARIDKPKGALDRARFNVKLHCLDCSVRYVRFPYELTDIRGEVEFTPDEMKFSNLSGRHKTNEIRMSAKVTDYLNDPDVKMDIWCDRAACDEDLYEVLGPLEQEMWRMFDPKDAFCKVHVRVLREKGAEGAPEAHIDADIISGTIQFEYFPYLVEGEKGRIHVGPEGIILGQPLELTPEGDIDYTAIPKKTGLFGKQGPATAQILGHIIPPPEGWKIPQIRIVVLAHQVPLDDRLMHALPPDIQQIYRYFNLTGFADVKAEVFTTGKKPQEVEWLVNAYPKRAGLTYVDFPYAIGDVTGQMRITKDRVDLIDLNGRHDNVSLSTTGFVQLEPNNTDIDIRIEAKGAEFSTELFEALPEQNQRLWERFNPKGEFDLAMRMTGSPRQPDWVLDLFTKNDEMIYRDFPYPLKNVTGRIRATRGRVEVKNLESHEGPMVLRLNGVLDLEEDGYTADMSLDVVNMPLDERLYGAIPPGARALWDAIEPDGKIGLRMDSLKFVGGNEEEDGEVIPACQFKGVMEVKEGSMHLSSAITDIEGKAELSGQWNAGGKDFALAAVLGLDKLAYGDWLLTRFKGNLGKLPNVQRVTLTGIEADFYEGKTEGQVSVETGGEDPQYAVNLRLLKVSLPEFIAAGRESEATGEKPRPKTKGNIDAEIYLSGPLGKLSKRQGRGEVLLEKAKLMDTPLMLAILDVLNLKPPDPNAFEEARILYHIRGTTVHLERVELEGKGLGLAGQGTYELETGKIGLSMVVVNRDFSMPLISELLTGAQQQFAEIRVTGTLSKPDVKTEALRELGDKLRNLIRKREP
jgi:hypothetical protein